MPLYVVMGSMAHPTYKAVLGEWGMGSLGHSVLHSSAIGTATEMAQRAKGFILHTVKAAKQKPT